MKKFLALVLTLVLALTAVACGAPKAEAPTDSDLAYVTEKGKLVVGITDFAPMDYKNPAGEWIGFDADLAKLFATELGVEVEFVEIEWSNKILELNNKSIDCVWNGMTLTDEVTAAMSCSTPYCNNQQIVIVPVEKKDMYQTEESLKELNFAVEDGSAGNKVAEEKGLNFTPVTDQATAVMEVASGTSDAAIIDSLMAAAMVGEGTGYEGLTYTIGLSDEEYGVGFRKGSDITEKFNAFLEEIKTSGKLDMVADRYGIQAALIK